MASYCVIPGERACEERQILSARDTTRSGYQTGASLVVTQGYVRKVINVRGGHRGLNRNDPIHSLLRSFAYLFIIIFFLHLVFQVSSIA